METSQRYSAGHTVNSPYGSWWGCFVFTHLQDTFESHAVNDLCVYKDNEFVWQEPMWQNKKHFFPKFIEVKISMFCFVFLSVFLWRLRGVMISQGHSKTKLTEGAQKIGQIAENRFLQLKHRLMVNEMNGLVKFSATQLPSFTVYYKKNHFHTFIFNLKIHVHLLYVFVWQQTQMLCDRCWIFICLVPPF